MMYKCKISAMEEIVTEGFNNNVSSLIFPSLVVLKNSLRRGATAEIAVSVDVLMLLLLLLL